MKRLLFILLILVFVSCNVNSKKSVDDVLLFKDFETYLMENEVADDDIRISISDFIDSVNDCRDNVNKYYVKGTLIKETLGTNMNVNRQEIKIYYLIVYLDNKKDTFSIEPYDGKKFIEGDIDGK